MITGFSEKKTRHVSAHDIRTLGLLPLLPIKVEIANTCSEFIPCQLTLFPQESDKVKGINTPPFSFFSPLWTPPTSTSVQTQKFPKILLVKLC